MMRRANILVVDHDEEFVRFASAVLARGGHRFISVDRASSALDKVRVQSFDLVLVAHELPDGDGIALLERIKDVGHFVGSDTTRRGTNGIRVSILVRACRMPGSTS